MVGVTKLLSSEWIWPSRLIVIPRGWRMWSRINRNEFCRFWSTSPKSQTYGRGRVPWNEMMKKLTSPRKHCPWEVIKLLTKLKSGLRLKLLLNKTPDRASTYTGWEESSRNTWASGVLSFRSHHLCSASDSPLLSNIVEYSMSGWSTLFFWLC